MPTAGMDGAGPSLFVHTLLHTTLTFLPCHLGRFPGYFYGPHRYAAMLVGTLCISNPTQLALALFLYDGSLVHMSAGMLCSGCAAATATAALGGLLLLTFMNASHRKTFYAEPRLFRTYLIDWLWERRTWAPMGKGHDASRAYVLTSVAPRYLPTERVREWLADGLPHWLHNSPPWFTDEWIQSISRQLDESLLPEGLRTAERKRQYHSTLDRLVHAFSLGIDLQEFESALVAAEEAHVDGNLLNRARNKLDDAKKRQQEAKDSVACEFWLIPADCIRHCTDERLPSYSELQATRPDWLVRKRMTLEGACLGEYTRDLAVSQ
jgi:hypothetical protein